MLWIDWLHLDWNAISAWIFGILLTFYVAIRLKNYFVRWSASPPKFLEPFVDYKESPTQRGMRQTKITIEGETEKLDPVIIWVIGRSPRFLSNIAYSLALQSKAIYLNEVKDPKISPRHFGSDKIDANLIFYRKAGQFGNEFDDPSQKRIKILLAPRIHKDLKHQSKANDYLILGERIKQEQIQTLEGEGHTIINLRGGHYFRGWELALLGELVAILKKTQGDAR